MLLGEGQRFTQREWLEPYTPEPDRKDDMLAESEAKLREVVSKLGRDPTGMLSDFDLHAPHISPSRPATPTQPSKTRQAVPSENTQASYTVGGSCSGQGAEDSAIVLPQSKRRRTNSQSGSRISSQCPPVNLGRRSAKASGAGPNPSETQGDNRTVTDFRTVSTCSEVLCIYVGRSTNASSQGTIAFMSVRVLNVPPGKPYHHSYLDDLESFFWLIFWCATAHTDSADHYPSPKAQNMLTVLNHGDLATMALLKQGLLTHCFSVGNGLLQQTLATFQNEWAEDDLFFTVIVGLGQFFFNVHVTPNVPRSPAGVFSQVVGIIQAALASAS
jgi:hypothetical protein